MRNTLGFPESHNGRNYKTKAEKVLSLEQSVESHVGVGHPNQLEDHVLGLAEVELIFPTAAPIMLLGSFVFCLLLRSAPQHQGCLQHPPHPYTRSGQGLGSP